MQKNHKYILIKPLDNSEKVCYNKIILKQYDFCRGKQKFKTLLTFEKNCGIMISYKKSMSWVVSENALDIGTGLLNTGFLRTV